ncbi:MAG: hypothetical protein ACJ74L_04775 [Gaiellaceae bacterium]
MTGTLALLTAAAALTTLPPLPERGLALETEAGVQLQSLSGRRLATLPALDLAPDQVTAHTLVLRARRGALFALDPAARRLRPRALHRGCRTTDVQVVVCAGVIKVAGRIVARKPRGIGHWVWAVRSPDRDALLAQWSAECEVPVAYLVADGKLHAYGAESAALGWLPGGAALIHFPNGPCGGGTPARGIYAVPRTGKPRLVLGTRRFAQYLMWGG